ncbi:MAG: phosphatidate cytidylyltransferase [Proteobacteria bacterium SG_bin5]|nr:phosphatidate cytidylyltransferase [Sphingomonas sp.]OQW42284.1 MAG: phosphatidate cytidylyltransferase [Proteobacteria bacterium SG_bin5]
MSRPPSELAARVAVGAALAAVALGALWLGGHAFWLLCVLMALGVLYEWAGLAQASAATRRLAQLALMVPLAILSPLAITPPVMHSPYFLALGLILGAAMFVGAVTRRGFLAAGVIYAGLPVLALLLIRDQPRGLEFAFWTFGLVWLCDIGAYFAGRAFGGPRLAPQISPNKTWAGALGGIALASVFAATLHWYSGLPWRLTLATPLLAILSELGDLFESWLKRRAGVKDSGTLLPGHGGLLDRLDGLVPVAPIAALLVMLPRIEGLWR